MRIFVSTRFGSGLAIARVTMAATALSLAVSAQTLTTLNSFNFTNGANPGAGVTFYGAGTLVGTAAYGGTSNNGTVYMLTPGAGGTWTPTVLYNFNGNPASCGTTGQPACDGATPESTLTIGPGSVLYGTTYQGGASGNGTVFKLSPPVSGGGWTETVLYSFNGAPAGCDSGGSNPTCDGANPIGGVVLGKGGVLYGTTFNGGGNSTKGSIGAGTAYELIPPKGGSGPWTENVIYTFLGALDGAGPQTDLTLRNGILYGGAYSGTEGTVFELHQSAGKWTKANIYSFAGFGIGAFPNDVIFDSAGVLYGTTQAGGKYGAGIVYSLKATGTKGKPWTETTIWSFTGGADGGSPYAGLTLGPLGVLYGTTTVGGTYTNGTVLQFTPPAESGPWTETVLYNFTGQGDGGEPFSAITIGKTGALYGTTATGGTLILPNTYPYGTVFELTLP
jgi:uncharacterized repeat protein (TIGR03803 family)